MVALLLYNYTARIKVTPSFFAYTFGRCYETIDFELCYSADHAQTAI